LILPLYPVAEARMKIKRFLVRYFPPGRIFSEFATVMIFELHIFIASPAGIILEYELRDKSREMKEIDLLHLTAECVNAEIYRSFKFSYH